MEPPASRAGQVATSVGILGAGAALGAAAGALYVPDSTVPKGAVLSQRGLATVMGGMVGTVLAAAGAAGLAAFTDSEWNGVEEDAAAIGLGVLAASSLLGAAQTLPRLKSAAAAPQLPASNPQNYTADSSNSGGTLVMRVGDTVTITLPGAPGSWSWSATQGIVTWVSEVQGMATFGNATSVDVFKGSAQGAAAIQAQMSDGTTFNITVNVISA
jgi:hypothetical protein